MAIETIVTSGDPIREKWKGDSATLTRNGGPKDRRFGIDSVLVRATPSAFAVA